MPRSQKRPVSEKFIAGKVTYPRIGRPSEPRPELLPAIFEARLARTRKAMVRRGLDAMVVYGDREHFGNIQWLTNYDPRFEETLLVVLPKGTPVLFVGNEGMGYSRIARLDVDRRLFQPLSLLGQPRDKVKPLDGLLRNAGLGGCRRIGAAGWKYFSESEYADHETVTDLPCYLAEPLRRAAARGGRVTNETALFMDPETGLRNLHEPEALADFEWIATHNSQNVLDCLRALRPGMTEYEAFATMPYNGAAFSCYSSLAAGDSVMRAGFPSPTSRRIGRGEPMFISYSYQGANCCRFGWVARGSNDLPAGLRDYAERAAVPYFTGLKAWYEALRIGATGDNLHHAVVDRLAPQGFRFALNIGHQIAMDEWTHSLSGDGFAMRVKSGMYWQADFWGALDEPHHAVFAEDGAAIADAALRRRLSARYPQMWKRVLARRKFMIDVLGMDIAEELLPFSNIAGAVTPYFLSPEVCVRRQTGR
jgi:Xaa-Pro aminopeptidase